MKKLATFGAGCFWGVQLKFDKLEGVIQTQVGYEGGKTKNPTYQEVCSNVDEHIEVIQIEYDDEKIIYETLLKLFFEMHDPTSVDRQGLDIGIQYRSIIFYHEENQKKDAENFIKRIINQNKFSSKIVTKIEKAQIFYKAEEYHQKYLEKLGKSTCRI